jgi:hypothetical protein
LSIGGKLGKVEKPIPEHFVANSSGRLTKHYFFKHIAWLLCLNHTALKEKVEISKRESSAFVEIPFHDVVSCA